MRGSIDLLAWQREELEKAGFTPEMIADPVAKLKVLAFDFNEQKGEGVISRIGKTYVFVKPSEQESVTVLPGEVWICLVESAGSVYNAIPLLKIDASMLFGLSDDIRDEIVEILWVKKRSSFMSQFEDRYKVEIETAATEAAERRFEAERAELQSKLDETRRQLELSMMISPMQAEGDIELDSEEVPEGAEPVQPKPHQETLEFTSPPTRAVYIQAPGIPEIRVNPSVGSSYSRPRESYMAVLESPDTIRIGGLSDGKCFAHISPNKGYMVIRPHGYGSVLCKDGGRIQIRGLERYSAFSGIRQLRAEYSPKYDGIIVYLAARNRFGPRCSSTSASR